MTATFVPSPAFPALGNMALVLVDVQNAFFHRDGENYYPEVVEVLPALHRLLELARAKRALVVHVADVHRPGHPDFEQLRLPPHGQSDQFHSGFFEGFGPAPGTSAGKEAVIIKRRFSAFLGTDLDLLLREHDIRRLIIAGVKTNVCIRATTQDAFGLGYATLVVEEATNSNRAHLAQASLEDIRRYMGWVGSLQQAEEVLA